MQELIQKYNSERIEFLRNNKSEITREILEDLRSCGIAGKRIALEVLELKENEAATDIHVSEMQKCKKDLFYFKDNYLLILNKDNLQDKMLNAILLYPQVQLTSDRQTRKSYAAWIYVLWLFNFYENKNIGLVSKRQMDLKHKISDITNLYNQLPSWMRVTARNLKTSMTSGLQTRIFIDIADTNSFRGKSIDTVIFENTSNIDPDKLKECLDSIMPTMHRNDYKIVLIESNPETPKDFFEVNEYSELIIPKPRKSVEKKKTFKEKIKNFWSSLYIYIRDKIKRK